MLKSREHEKDALVGILNIQPSSIETFFAREQAFGEIVGSQHVQQDYFDVVDSLQDELKQQTEQKDKSDANS